MKAREAEGWGGEAKLRQGWSGRGGCGGRPVTGVTPRLSVMQCWQAGTLSLVSWFEERAQTTTPSHSSVPAMGRNGWRGGRCQGNPSEPSWRLAGRQVDTRAALPES